MANIRTYVLFPDLWEKSQGCGALIIFSTVERGYMLWFDFCQLYKAGVKLEILSLSWAIIYIRLYKSMEHFLDWWLMWESLLAAGGTTTKKVVLGCIRKQAEQAIGSKTIGSIAPMASTLVLPSRFCSPWCLDGRL